MQIAPLLIQYDLALNADSFMLLFYSIPIYENGDLFIMNQSYYFSLGAHICIIQRELSDMGLCGLMQYILKAYPLFSYFCLQCLITMSVHAAVCGIALECITKEFYLHDKTSSLMT